MLGGCAGAQALTRKLSEAALGLVGKQHHAIMPPVEDPPTLREEAQNAALPDTSTLSGGRSSVLRPQVSIFCPKLRMLILKQQASLWTTAMLPVMGLHVIFHSKRLFCVALIVLKPLPQACGPFSRFCS